MRHIAPWPDFSGHPIMEGDRIVFPSGAWGTVILLPDETDEDRRWRIDYGHGPHCSLQSAVSEEGRAVVLDESGKVF